MNARIARMLTHIPQGADVTPHDVPSLSLSGYGTVALTDLTLFVTNTTTNRGSAIDLHHTSVAAVVQQIPAGIPATVIQDGPAELLLLANPAVALPATLTIATNPLWQVLAAISRALTTQARSQSGLAAQLNARGATGMALDEWAASLGVARHAGEPDDLFILRLVGQTLNPAVNNTAIANLLNALGYPSTVTDTSPGNFEVDIEFPTYLPQGFSYTQAQLAAIVGDAKALGMIAVVNFLNELTETASVTDSVTVNSTELSANTWDNVEWGMFAWQ